MQLKNKLMLTGAAAVAVLSFGLKANAAADNRPTFDLSEWQGTISDKQAKMLKSEAKGVILRVQYGSNYRDRVFDHNAAVLKDHGVKFGVYAFAQYVNSKDAKVEAKNFYTRAKKYKPLFYVNDAEAMTTYPGHSFAAATKSFAEQMQSMTSKPIFIYSYQSFYRSYINSKSGYDGMWLAAYQRQAPVTTFTYQLWQNQNNHYSSSLHLAVDSSKFMHGANWFGHTVDCSKFPVGGFKVGDKVALKSGITYYGSSVKADSSLAKKSLTVKEVRTVYTGKSNQILTVYNGKQVIGQVRAQDVVEVKRAVAKRVVSAKWVNESKTYTLKTAVNLRAGASTSARVIAPLSAGTTVKTDRAIIKGGYRWVRQPRSHGYGYLVTGPASDSLFYVKSGASHAYYKVKFGDSWWVIAQRNGVSVYALAAKNGKSIYSTIYPGEKVIVK